MNEHIHIPDPGSCTQYSTTSLCPEGGKKRSEGKREGKKVRREEEERKGDGRN